MIFSRQKLIIAAIGLLALLLAGALIAWFGAPEKNEGPVTPPAKLEFWGVFDGTDVFGPLADDFNKRYKHLTVNYRKFTIEEYEDELTRALVAGKGPDLYLVNNTWVPRYLERLRPASPLVFDTRTFRDAFVDTAYEDLVAGQRVYGIPLHIDTLALFTNKEYLASAGIALPPATWDEFLKDVKLLTRRDAQGNIMRAGAALGTAKNVSRSFDILSLLMLQQGAKMVSDNRSNVAFDSPLAYGSESFYPGERALTFYTDFANPRKQVYTWNTLQHFSLDAFLAGEAAMMVNYARVIPLLEARAPYLKWGVSPMPQIAGRDVDVNFGNYWALVVAATSKNAEQAWQFLKFMAERNSAKMYADAARRPVARKDLVDIQRTDEKLGVFAVQALSAKSWYQVDNRAIEELFAEMIESVVKGADSPREAVTKAARQVRVLMVKNR